MKSSFQVNAEYFGVRAVCSVVNAIPYELAMRMAGMIGRLLFSVFRLKRKRTIDRIRQVFPGLSRNDENEIAIRSLQNLLQTGLEMMRAPRLTREWMDKHVVDGQRYKDLLQELVDEGNGVVIMVPHSGNWYMAAWSMAKYGLHLFAIAARQRNPKLNAWMDKQYGDIEVLDRDNRETLSRIKDKLRQGEAFAILPDLRVRKRDVEVDFFGSKANVSHAGAMFAVRCGCPIVVAQMYRDHGKHVFNHIATLRPDSSADPKQEAVRLTQKAMALLDAEIRKRPGDWFWYNKRWILEPPEN